jgi:hypothetical protein
VTSPSLVQSPVGGARCGTAAPSRDAMTAAWDDYADACLEHDPLHARVACDQLRYALEAIPPPKVRR